MICRTCGRELQIDQSFCPNCGTINEQAKNNSKPPKQEQTEQTQNVFYEAQYGPEINRQPKEEQRNEHPGQQEHQAQESWPQAQQGQSGQPMNQQAGYQRNVNPAYQQVPSNQPYPNQPYPNQPYPSRPYPTQPYPNQPSPGQPYPNQPYPGQPYPNQPYPGQSYPNQPYPTQSYQGGRGTLPPPLPPNAYKRRSKGPLYVFLVLYTIFVLLLGAFYIAVFVEAFRQAESSGTASNISNGVYYDTEESGGYFGENQDELQNNEYFSYTELPDVISIDSDWRFMLNDRYEQENSICYEFLFASEGSEDEFYMGIAAYETLLEEKCGFLYEEGITDGQNQQAGEQIDYYSQGDILLGVSTQKLEDSYYVTINLFLPPEDTQDGGQQESYNNYNYFVIGREQTVFDLKQEVTMENKISFLLDEINITDLGDGNSVFVAEIKMKSEQKGNYFCLDDFLILPMDAEYNMLADATAAAYVKDVDGNELTAPLELPTEDYGIYTVSFILPMNTQNFNVYGTNYYNDGFSGPVYLCEMVVNE